MITLEGIAPDMIANNLEPMTVTHPGEVLREEIECRGITQKQLAAELGISYSVLNEVINCKWPVNTEYALLLEAALGIEADFWLNMQTRYNMVKAKRNIPFMERLKKIRKIAAL